VAHQLIVGAKKNIMAVLTWLNESVLAFHCPGCECMHGLHINKPNYDNGAQWTWNGNYDKPTFNPSVHVWYERGGVRTTSCHCWVRDGMIEFLGDSSHSLAGTTVPMVDVDA